jgi:hypothetical protein
VVAANIVAIIAIAATIKRDRYGRYGYGQMCRRKKATSQDGSSPCGATGEVWGVPHCFA